MIGEAQPKPTTHSLALSAGSAAEPRRKQKSEQAARNLKNSRLIAVKQRTHGTGSPCIDDLIADFVKQGSAAGLDTSCPDQIHLPPFVTQRAGK
jgi:hypothetical protein